MGFRRSRFCKGSGATYPPPVLRGGVAPTVTESDKTETGARQQALKQLKAERDRLQARIETMYMDRLDGRISAAFFDEKSREWREQQKQIEAGMKQLETTQLRSATEVLQTIRFVSEACSSFGDSQPQQQRALVAALMQQATWKAGKFESSWKSPWRLIRNGGRP